MKGWQKIISGVAMFLLIFVILLTSFQAAIYGDPNYGFYRKAYEKYKVTDDLNMDIEDVMVVTDYMMDYLIGKEAELSIVIDVDGKNQDFFNEQDRLHMADVRNLFIGGLKLRNILAILILGMLLILGITKADLKKILPKSYLLAFVVFLAVAAFLGIAFTIDFTRCFTIFHEIFFTNDLWLFDPATDYMIRMLPEGFFSDMVLRIGVCFVGTILLLGAIMLGIMRIERRQRVEKRS